MLRPDLLTWNQLQAESTHKVPALRPESGYMYSSLYTFPNAGGPVVSHRTLVMQLSDGMSGSITADTSYSGSQRCVRAKLRRGSFGVKSPFYVRLADKGKVQNGQSCCSNRFTSSLKRNTALPDITLPPAHVAASLQALIHTIISTRRSLCCAGFGNLFALINSV